MFSVVFVNLHSFFAERLGFEPRVHFWRTHTFQACSFDHSDTSPKANELIKMKSEK